jgi:hypothetical protein
MYLKNQFLLIYETGSNKKNKNLYTYLIIFYTQHAIGPFR